VPSLGCNADVQEVPTVVLEFSPGLFWAVWISYFLDKAVPFLPVGLDIFCELHPKASTELYSMMQNSHCYTVYHYPPVSSNQHFELHSRFSHNHLRLSNVLERIS
jgi:hypothetical protein